MKRPDSFFSTKPDSSKRQKNDEAFESGTTCPQTFDPAARECIVLYTFSTRPNGTTPVGPCCRPSEAVTFLRRSCLSVRRQLPPDVRILVVTETPDALRILLKPFRVHLWTLDHAWHMMNTHLPAEAASLGAYASTSDVFTSIGHARVWLLPLLRVLAPLSNVLYLDDDAGIQTTAHPASILSYRGLPLAYEVDKKVTVRHVLAPHIQLDDKDPSGAEKIVNNGVILMPCTPESTDVMTEVLSRYCEMKRTYGHVMYWDMVALTAVWHARRLRTVRDSGLPIIHLYAHKYRADSVSKMLSTLGTWRKELDDELVRFLESDGSHEQAVLIAQWSKHFFDTDWPLHLISSVRRPAHIESVDMERLMRSRSAKR
jgi:hypothetical protein